jgi:hypothetical protein
MLTNQSSNNNQTNETTSKPAYDPYKNIKIDRTVVSHDAYQKSLRVNFPKNYFGLKMYTKKSGFFFE